MNLAPLVALYRVASEKSIDGHLFSGTVEYSVGVGFIQKIRNPSNRYGRFTILSLDGRGLYDDEDIPHEGNQFRFSIALPAMDACQFYSDIDGFIAVARSKISRGEIPHEYYLVKDDVYSLDQGVTHPGKLFNFCKIICGLKNLALYHDEKSQGVFKLVFVQPSTDLVTPPLVIETHATPDIIDSCEGLDLRSLEYLQKDNPDDHHYSAKVDVFKVSLTSFLSGKVSAGVALAYLIQHWEEFLQAYQRDLSTYLSGFAFHKAKREVAAAEMEIAEKFSNLMTDIASKALAIPISLAALIALPEAGSPVVSFTIIGGLFLAGLIIFAVVWNQKSQFGLICHAKDIALDALEGRRESYPPELKAELNRAVTGVKKNQKFVGWLLNGLLSLSFVPFILSFLVYWTIDSEKLIVVESVEKVEVVAVETPLPGLEVEQPQVSGSPVLSSPDQLSDDAQSSSAVTDEAPDPIPPSSDSQ